MDEADNILLPSTLADGLRVLGVAAGQTIMLHASVKALGWVLGGPRAVLETLLDLVTPSGADAGELGRQPRTRWRIGRWRNKRRVCGNAHRSIPPPRLRITAT